MKEFLKNHFISMILLILMGAYATVNGLIQRGAKEETKDFIVQVLKEKTNSKDFMDEVMNTEYMEDYKAVEKLKTITTILSSTKEQNIDYFKILSEKTGLTIEALTDSLVIRIKTPNFTKSECILNSKKYGRRNTAIF